MFLIAILGSFYSSWFYFFPLILFSEAYNRCGAIRRYVVEILNILRAQVKWRCQLGIIGS